MPQIIVTLIAKNAPIIFFFKVGIDTGYIIVHDYFTLHA